MDDFYNFTGKIVVSFILAYAIGYGIFMAKEKYYSDKNNKSDTTDSTDNEVNEVTK